MLRKFYKLNWLKKFCEFAPWLLEKSQAVECHGLLLQRGLELARAGDDVGEGALGERVIQNTHQGVIHLVQYAGFHLRIKEIW